MSTNQTIGDTIHALRIKNGIGLRELAREAGVSLSMLQRIEEGGNTTVETANRILAVMGRELSTRAIRKNPKK